ncbi:MAG: FHA domain-containing protein [Myxococcales bacterium]
MKRLMLSVLARMHRTSTLQEFLAVHPNCWLVWEPGAWKPPSPNGPTVPDFRAPSQAPRPGEALAFGFPLDAGQVTLGRTPSCDIEINDATISQLHLSFMKSSANLWTVRDAGSTNGTWLGEQRLARGVPHLLGNAARIHAGQVALTFYTPGELLPRLRDLQVAKAAGTGHTTSP